MQNHAIPCNTMQYHAIPCNTMQYNAIPCDTMQYYAIPCNTMQYHAIRCIINNCWRSVPLPCGQYKAIFCFILKLSKMKGHQLSSGQVVIGGLADNQKLSSVEIFPPPPSDSCSIPDLPSPRSGHSLSLLSGGRLVVCGGESTPESRSCIVWARGSTDWTHLHTLRSAYFIFRSNLLTHSTV